VGTTFLKGAINMLCEQIILQRGLPSEGQNSSARFVDVQALSQEEMNTALEKGYEDMKAGRTRPASKVFADIRKDYA
jgi:DNA-damage-inducible protein J